MTTSLTLTPEISALVSGAFESGNVLLLAAVSAESKPLLSFRGSTAVFGDSQLSFWARNAVGETMVAIRQNPHVALMYRSQSVPLLKFIGRARISDNADERDRAFNLAHAKEREKDPERKGRAVIIDLDEVKGVLGFKAGMPIAVNLIRG
jgi:hypothetical protein